MMKRKLRRERRKTERERDGKKKRLRLNNPCLRH